MDNLYIPIAEIAPFFLDTLWAEGYRNFGSYFFRYQYDTIPFYFTEPAAIIPLRINIDKFEWAKSQKKIIHKNQDLECKWQAINIDQERENLFHKHKQRFKENIPNNVRNFIGEEEDYQTDNTKEIACYFNGKLIAVSFVGVGQNALSSIYAMFDPDYNDRSLGVFTLLQEIEQVKKMQMQYLYLGYAHQVPSFYDYKKKFYGLEAFDWNGNWQDFPRESNA
ncbi:MAG: arginine-tRNA-protein transferase [Cytophagales bacterium]|nr:MAG: arginine-tRNA-protein transferase [Cytophagales bacterium]